MTNIWCFWHVHCPHEILCAVTLSFLINLLSLWYIVGFWAILFNSSHTSLFWASLLLLHGSPEVHIWGLRLLRWPRFISTYRQSFKGPVETPHFNGEKSQSRPTSVSLKKASHRTKSCETLRHQYSLACHFSTGRVNVVDLNQRL